MYEGKLRQRRRRELEMEAKSKKIRMKDKEIKKERNGVKSKFCLKHQYLTHQSSIRCNLRRNFNVRVKKDLSTVQLQVLCMCTSRPSEDQRHLYIYDTI
jgi:hypothetical protein